MPFLSQEGKQVWDKQFHAVFVRALRKADAQHKKENRAPDPGWELRLLGSVATAVTVARPIAICRCS